MQQHPVPQNITGFEFKLIGFLTLRQFGYLAAAAVTDFILYSAGVPILAVFALGAPITILALGLAFLRVNDLPFERWLAAFLKTVYSPNVRVWHREPKTIGFLEPQFSVYLQHQGQTVGPKVVSDRTKLNQYLQAHGKQIQKSLVDVNEERRLAQLSFPNESQILTAPTLQPNPQENLTPQRLQRMSQVVSRPTDPNTGEAA